MTSEIQSVPVQPAINRKIAWFLPSLTDVAFLMPIVFQFNQLGGAPALLADGDTGWHLRTGEWILAHGQVPKVDMYSYTHEGQPWFAWEWLWDLCFGVLNQHFGLALVVALSLLIICCTSALLYRLVLRKCHSPLLAIDLTLLADAGASIHWLARPHLFTMLFTVIFLGILDETYEEALAKPYGFSTRKLLWWLPAMTVLWTNLHGGFVAGLLLIGAYAGGWLLEAALEPEPEAKKSLLARSKPFIWSGVLCTLASLVNPYFIGLHEHIVKFLMDPYFSQHIQEFLSFDFGHPASKYIEVLMLLGVAAACWNLYRRRFGYFLLLTGWLHLALHSRRHVPLFSIVCAPLVAEALHCWLRDLETVRLTGRVKKWARSFQESSARMAGTDRLPRLYLTSAAGIFFVAVILFAPNPPEKFRPSQDPKGFPVAAVNKLIKDGDQRIFTSDLWGGYLIYRMYPHSKVFIDGRSDFYGAAFELKYIDVMEARYDWEQNLARYDVRTVLVPTDWGLASALKENPHWQVVYDDKIAIMFRQVHPDRLHQRSEQVSNCPNQGVGENCGKTASAAFPVDRPLSGLEHPKTNFVAEIGPPRLPLLNHQ